MNMLQDILDGVQVESSIELNKQVCIAIASEKAFSEEETSRIFNYLSKLKDETIVEMLAPVSKFAVSRAIKSGSFAQTNVNRLITFEAGLSKIIINFYRDYVYRNNEYAEYLYNSEYKDVLR